MLTQWCNVKDVVSSAKQVWYLIYPENVSWSSKLIGKGPIAVQMSALQELWALGTNVQPQLWLRQKETANLNLLLGFAFDDFHLFCVKICWWICSLLAALVSFSNLLICLGKVEDVAITSLTSLTLLLLFILNKCEKDPLGLSAVSLMSKKWRASPWKCIAVTWLKPWLAVSWGVTVALLMQMEHLGRWSWKKPTIYSIIFLKMHFFRSLCDAESNQVNITQTHLTAAKGGDHWFWFGESLEEHFWYKRQSKHQTRTDHLRFCIFNLQPFSHKQWLSP